MNNWGICDRACVLDKFQGLSHFNVWFPELGASCLPANTQITGTCSNGNFVLGDGSCGGSQSQVAKCDNTNLAPGECLTMTLNIPGENTGPGLGVVVSKAGNNCVESCMAGPSCEPCDGGNGGGACLTRTRGFWGTHPHIAADFLPITVCGKDQMTTVASVCGTSEALCTSAQDRQGNPPSLTLVAQLTAAKLNLAATLETVDGTCEDWEYGDKSIQEWIALCDTPQICNASKQAISGSGCIEALDAFNNSLDTGFDEVPPPFDQPGPAQVGECQKARGNGISNYNCSQP
jgi:hypothetical protein